VFDSLPAPLEIIGKLDAPSIRSEGGKATVHAHVCFWHKADITIVVNHVRFWGQSGHSADLLRHPNQQRSTLGNKRHDEASRIAANETGWISTGYTEVLLATKSELHRKKSAN
jgi:hypothetical protein